MCADVYRGDHPTCDMKLSRKPGSYRDCENLPTGPGSLLTGSLLPAPCPRGQALALPEHAVRLDARDYEYFLAGDCCRS